MSWSRWKHITFCYVCQGQRLLDVALGEKLCVVASQWQHWASNPPEPVSLSLGLVHVKCACAVQIGSTVWLKWRNMSFVSLSLNQRAREREILKKVASLISVFPSMAEILNGGVKISNNPKLCNMDTVLWNDIIDTSRKPLTVLDFASNLSSCKY